MSIRGTETPIDEAEVRRMIEELRSKIGWKILEGYDWNEYATKDGIRHFARGLGDSNPLWIDEEYAKNSRFKGITAPPTYLYSVDVTTGVGGARWGPPLTRGATYGGGKWEWYEPIREGDRFSVEKTLYSVDEKHGKVGGWFYVVTFQNAYKNQHGRIAAKAWAWQTWHMQGAVGYTPRQRTRYTREELSNVKEDILKEERRGATPRYWEDVNEGEVLPPVVKGPITIVDYIGWVAGRGAYWGTLEHAKTVRDPDSWFWVDSHVSLDEGERVGMGGANIDGMCLVAWSTPLLTNWIGDDGWLASHELRLVKPVLHHDTIYYTGKVTRKFVDGKDHKVEIEVNGTNQLKEPTAKGKSVVILPSKR